MLMILPFVIVILIIVAINHIYYSDVKPKNLKNPLHVEKKADRQDATQEYLDRYIKR